MTIGKKIAMGFAVIVAVTVISGLLSHGALLKILGTTNDTGENLTSYRAIYIINDRVQANETDISELINQPDADGVQARWKDVDQNCKDTDDAFSTYQNALGDDQTDAANFQKLQGLRAPWEDARAEMTNLIQAGKFADARQAYFAKLDPAFGSYMDQIDGMIKYNDDQIIGAIGDLSSDVEKGLAAVRYGSGACVIVGVILGFYITRSLARVLGELTHSLAVGAEHAATAAAQVSASSQALAQAPASRQRASRKLVPASKRSAR